MDFGRVIGRVVLTRKDPKLEGLKLLVVQPINEHYEDQGQPLIAVDSVGAGASETVCYTTSRDASWPFGGESPIDACVTGIIDITTIDKTIGVDES
ncbi:MAG: EutN/CcmL family microcompartment protein [Firmicutes bacterium]|nr:EutN/CcmL family microcompartment protein [Bacillota bacterium]